MIYLGNPFKTSNNFYAISGPTTMQNKLSLEEKLNLKKANFEFGHENPGYDTSNHMQPIVVVHDKAVKFNSSKHNSPKQGSELLDSKRTNHSHFRLAQSSRPKLSTTTTYSESTAARRPLSMARISKHGEKNYSSVVLGFQSQHMVSEARDNFQAKDAQIGRYGKQQMQMHVRVRKSHFILGSEIIRFETLGLINYYSSQDWFESFRTQLNGFIVGAQVNKHKPARPNLRFSLPTTENQFETTNQKLKSKLPDKLPIRAEANI